MHYDADRQRWKQLYFNGTANETTIFVGGILEKHTANGATEFRHTITAGEQPVALYSRPSSGSITTQYFLLDHLGSVAEITNSLGLLDVAENFAAFGERRDATDWSGAPSAADQTIINAASQRGYTFHTNSEASSLIHMNGRLADARTGRFLSPDPYVFQPHLTQGFNRYSYVNNNPLSFTDSSGFCAELVSGYVCNFVIGSALSYIGSKLFGKKKPPPPPKGCFVKVGGTGCYGKATATKLFDIARDIYGLPRLGAPPVWGVGNGTFGSCPGGWGPGCMSFGGELYSQTEEAIESRLDKAFRRLSSEQQQELRDYFEVNWGSIFEKQELYTGDLSRNADTMSDATGAGTVILWWANRANIYVTASDVALKLFNASRNVSQDRKLYNYRQKRDSYLKFSGAIIYDMDIKGPWKSFDWGPYQISGKNGAQRSVDFYLWITDQVDQRPPSCAISGDCE